MKRHSRIVWISGASSGIGKSLLESFANGGDVVIGTSRRLDTLTTLVRKLNRYGKHCEAMRCDVTKETDVQRVARSILQRHKKVDILVNNAGITTLKDFLRTSTSEFDDILATNVRGLFLTSKALLPAMLKRKRGTILNVLSYAAKTTYTKSAAYTAAKSGAEAMMNVLRAEVREKGIKVVNVYPGAVLTPMWSAGMRKRHARSMMSARDIAALLYRLTLEPDSLHVEELVVRPPAGDLHV